MVRKGCLDDLAIAVGVRALICFVKPSSSFTRLLREPLAAFLAESQSFTSMLHTKRADIPQTLV